MSEAIPGRRDLEDDYNSQFSDVDVIGGVIGGWQETARVDNVLRSRTWRVTAHEPRPNVNISGNTWQPQYLPIAPAASTGAPRFVDVDAGLLMRVRWQRDRTSFQALVDYTPGFSFTVQAGALDVAVRGRFNPAQLLPIGGGSVICGATIEPAHAGAMSAWPPTRSKDTGDIAPVSGLGATDEVRILIPPHARAFRWHQYKGAALGAATAVTFIQSDNAGGAAFRSSYRTATTPASWPNATGAIPIVGTAQVLRVLNNDPAGGSTIAMWIEFLLDLGG